MKRRPPCSTRTDKLCPYTVLVRAVHGPARAARRPRAKLDEAPRGGQGFGQAHSGAWRVVRPRRWRPAGGAAARCAGVRGPDRGARMTRRLSLFGATGSVGQSTLDLVRRDGEAWRSEEHTSELQSLMRISYAVFCLK